MNKKAFLLFEVTLTIAILSLGLVFVVRSISSSMKAARASFNYSQAVNLAYEKTFDLELESQADGIETTSDNGVFVDDERFSWEYTVEGLYEEDLGKLTLDISWQEAKAQAGFNIETYIKISE